MATNFFPLADEPFAGYTANFGSVLMVDPVIYGTSPQTATDYVAKQADYATRLAAALAGETRGKASIFAKNESKKILVEATRAVSRQIQGSMIVSDAMRIAIGLPVRDRQPTPVPRPVIQPGVDVVSVLGRDVKCHVHDSTSPSKRSRPAGSMGAYIYTYVGTVFPADPSAWEFYSATTKSECVVSFQPSIPAGSQVWICATFYNRRGLTGPGSAPITTYLQYGSSLAA